jgi:hypothetical protein
LIASFGGYHFCGPKADGWGHCCVSKSDEREFDEANIECTRFCGFKDFSGVTPALFVQDFGWRRRFGAYKPYYTSGLENREEPREGMKHVFHRCWNKHVFSTKQLFDHPSRFFDIMTFFEFFIINPEINLEEGSRFAVEILTP